MNHTIVASFSFALLVAVALLVREVRFRRSLQKLLYRLLAFWRTNSKKSMTCAHPSHIDMISSISSPSSRS